MRKMTSHIKYICKSIGIVGWFNYKQTLGESMDLSAR